jgi:hypothetical protein
MHLTNFIILSLVFTAAHNVCESLSAKKNPIKWAPNFTIYFCKFFQCSGRKRTQNSFTKVINKFMSGFTNYFRDSRKKSLPRWGMTKKYSRARIRMLYGAENFKWTFQQQNFPLFLPTAQKWWKFVMQNTCFITRTPT